jgi:hypothetical protein
MIVPMAWLFAGGAVGLASMWSLQWTAERLRPGTSLAGIALAMGGIVVRLGVAAALVLMALRHGGLPAGLAALGGLWLVRWIVSWRLSRSTETGEPRVVDSGG